VAASRSRSPKAAGVMAPCFQGPVNALGGTVLRGTRTASNRENKSVAADSIPGKRVLSSRATRKGTRRETRARASGEEASGYAERCREAYAYAVLHA